jgi:deazaflavin-dependent oxidoreductase (nitroreductase family)
MKSYRHARRVHRLVRSTAATRATAKLYGVIQEPIDRLVHRATGGATTASGWLAGTEIAMLTTTGAKSGLPRTLPVLALRDGEDTILIASNFGRERNPAWCHNLRANPRATLRVGDMSRDVVAHELHGAERERGYQRGAEVFPAFAQYRRWTDREIPVFRACPISVPHAVDSGAGRLSSG